MAALALAAVSVACLGRYLFAIAALCTFAFGAAP